MPSFLSYAEGLTAYLDWPGTLKACTTTAYVHNFLRQGLYMTLTVLELTMQNRLTSDS